MKIFAILLLILPISDLSFSNPFWIKQPSPTSQNLRDCIFINSSTGWISGDSGTICKTTNSGSTWQTQITGTTKEILDLFFLNDRLGWALIVEPLSKSPSKAGTTILKTTDGGNVWTHFVFPDSTIYFSSIAFTDSLNGVAGTFPYFMHYSTDGGISWRQSTSDSVSFNGFPILRIRFVNSTTGFACGGIRDLGGIVWKTTNSGLNWKPRVLGPDNLNDIYLVDDDSLYVVSGDFKFGANLFTSQDGGINWHIDELGYFGICSAIDFRTPNEGWITLGYGQRFFYTRNGGTDWTLMETPDSTAIFDITFADSSNGWAVGDGGAVLKYELKTGINDFEINYSPNTFILNQNYPNPFNPQTEIEFVLFEKSNVVLKVFDINGKLIRTLVDRVLPSGSHAAKFSGHDLPSGIYFYVMSISNSKQKTLHSRKMIMLK